MFDFSQRLRTPTGHHKTEILSCERPQVEKDEEPQEVEAQVLLPHEVFGALHRADQSKAGK